ncbi:MAG: DUF3147 family protein [Planctomycetota bacterium]|jgi:uncharacterized membrane protein (GlpM family)
MRFVIKLLISVCVIGVCAQIGRKLPSLAGLIAVMPLTGVVVLVWLYVDNPNNFSLMTDYTRGAMWGILPSILFFVVAYLCFRKRLALWIVLCAGFGVWLIAAVVHQWLINK